MASTFQYPKIVSRTLDSSGKSLRTIVALHDHEITDADLNDMQDLQDLKRTAVLNDMVASGCLTYAPFQFSPTNPVTFTIPSFDVLFNGTVVTVAGNQSPDLSINRVSIPQPVTWTTGAQDEDARIYVAFLELWYQSLNPITGQGYYPGFFYYPYGGVQPDPSNAESLPDDSIDATAGGLFTTERVQIQWRINVQRVSLQYNFQNYKFGLDQDTADTNLFGVAMGVYGQAQLPQATLGISPLVGLLPYQFTYMGGNPNIPSWNNTANYVDGNVVLYNEAYYVAYINVPVGVPPVASTGQINTAYWNIFPINGDTGLWVAGDGNVNNSLGTMDGYTYAMPLAVCFQRNSGNFDVQLNPFGCANAAISNSGTTISGVSGRFDNFLADQIFPADVVDTRSIVQLQGYDADQTMRFGFGDLVTGNTTLAVSRGLSPGNKSEALGSTLEYTIVMGAATLTNTAPIGQFDGYMNGFSSDQRTFLSTVAISTAQKTAGTPNTNWVNNDAFAITLPSISNGVISAVEVTALVSNASAGTKTPATLLQGQFEVSGLGTASISVQFVVNLASTAFDPGANNLYVTLGVTYPAGSGRNLLQIPFSVDGGLLTDAASGITLNVYGVSEYDVASQQAILPPQNPAYQSTPWVGNSSLSSVQAVNPEYSNIIFGTRINLQLQGSVGTQSTVGGQPVTTFVIPTSQITGFTDALYVVLAQDLRSAVPYLINNQTMITTTGTGTQVVIVLGGAVPTNSIVALQLIAQNTCQLAYNAPVKGVTSMEETVLFGNVATFQGGQFNDQNYPMDTRINIESVIYNATTQTSTIVLGANGCTITGIAGNDLNQFIWVVNTSSNTPPYPATAIQVQSVSAINGTVTVVVPGVILQPTVAGAQPFFFVGSINPAFTNASSLILSEQYIPYQGEGILNRPYEILHSEDSALLTTNGTGAAPLIGIADVYPYNRELPIITMLPAQTNWNDANLTNTPLATFFDSNYVTMQNDDVEATFNVPLHVNDFVPPFNKDTRKTITFTATAQNRGFGTALPHIGFGIATPTPRTVLGQNLQTTVAAITLYVDNVKGSDSNSGLATTQAVKTLGYAISLLPPVLTFPCVILCADTGTPFSLTTIPNINAVALGDGNIRSSKVYCVANLSHVIQQEGRLVISQTVGATNPVIIDATGFTGFGDGPTCAFYIDTSRVILNGIEFRGFNSPAIIAYSADVDMVDCSWVNNFQAAQFVGCSSVILDTGLLSVPDASVGIVAIQSNVTSSNVTLNASGPNFTPGAFYTVERNGVLNLQTHAAALTQEYNGTFASPQPFSASNLVAEALINSSVSVTADFQTGGSAVISANSILSRTVLVNPFLGGVVADASSNIVNQVS